MGGMIAQEMIRNQTQFGKLSYLGSEQDLEEEKRSIYYREKNL